MKPNKAVELNKYLNDLGKEYTPQYLFQQVQEALTAVAFGHTTGAMSDIACQIYLFLV